MTKYDLYMKPNQVWDNELNYSVEDSDDVYTFITEKLELQHRDREVFLVIALNSAGDAIGFMEAAVGELNSTMVHPREIGKFMILANASAVVFAHNHPSGYLKPSKDDKKTTERLVKCGELLGIKVIDHLIIGRNGFYSMRDNGDIY